MVAHFCFDTLARRWYAYGRHENFAIVLEGVSLRKLQAAFRKVAKEGNRNRPIAVHFRYDHT